MKRTEFNINRRIAAAIAVGIILGLLVVVWALSLFMQYSIAEPVFIPPDTLSEHDFAISDDKLLLLNTKGIKSYNKDGEYRWDSSIKTASPMLVSSADRFVVADFENATAFNMTKEKVNYTIESKTPVIGAIINSNGYTGIISSEHGYRSILTIYDDFGNEFYKWYSGEGYISAAAISNNNKNMATCAISSSSNTVQTIIHFFDMRKTEQTAQVILENEVAYKLIYDNNFAYVLTDKGIYSFNKKGVLKNSYPFTGRLVHAFSFNSTSDIAIALSRTDETGSMLSGSDVVFLNKKLKQKASVPTEFEVSAMDSNDGYTIICGLRNVWLMKNNGKVKLRNTLKSDCDRIKLFDDGDAFVTLAGSTTGIYKVKMG